MFFPRISRASDGMNAQSASFFARMVYVHPELAGYLHNTSNLSLIESWMTDVVGMGPSEMYDMDTVALLSVKGRTNLADDFVTLPPTLPRLGLCPGHGCQRAGHRAYQESLSFRDRCLPAV